MSDSITVDGRRYLHESYQQTALDTIRSQKQRIAELEADSERVQSLIRLVGGLPCPQPGCNDTGGYPVQDRRGDCYQEQCEFCWTVPESRFALAAAQESDDEMV